MPKITFIMKNGTSREIEASAGLSVMQAAVDNNIDGIEGACGGCLSCATCHVYVHPDWEARVNEQGARDEEEDDMMDLAFDVRPQSRLSCQIEVSDALDGLVLALPGANVDW